MPFDPDAYLQKYGYGDNGAQRPSMPTTGFNPDAYLAKATGKAPQPTQTTSPYLAGLEHFGNAAALGYLPQLQAAAEPYTNKLFTALNQLQGKPTAPEDNSTYVQRRDENIARLQQEAKEHPYAAIGGLLAGSVASGTAGGAALPEIAGLGNVGRAAAAGGLLGAVQNPGDIQGQISGPQIGERLQNAATGAAVGGVAEKLLGAAQEAPQSLKTFAQEKAFKSSGAMLKDFRAAAAKDQVNQIGQYMIDNGLVKPGMSFEDIANQSAQLKQQTGAKIGEVYDRLADAATKNPDLVSNSFAIADPQTIVADLTAATRDPKVMPKLNTSAYRDQMDNLIQQIASSGQTHDVRYLNDVIGELDSKINWAKRTPDMSELQQGLVAMRRTLRNKVNSIADRLGDTDEALSQHLKQLNSDYGNAVTINKIASDRIGRESANRLLSPSDYGAAGIGALLGSQFGNTPEERIKHAVMGAALGGVNKIGRLYGNPIITQGANALGKGLQKVGVQNIPNNPAIVGGAAGNIVNQMRR